MHAYMRDTIKKNTWIWPLKVLEVTGGRIEVTEGQILTTIPKRIFLYLNSHKWHILYDMWY